MLKESKKMKITYNGVDVSEDCCIEVGNNTFRLDQNLILIGINGDDYELNLNFKKHNPNNMESILDFLVKIYISSFITNSGYSFEDVLGFMLERGNINEF